MDDMRPSEHQTASLEAALDRYGSVPWITRGVSMRPLIVSGRDIVTISRFTGELKPGDVALYCRYSRNGKQYLLHRVIGVEPGCYRILGDNCIEVERVPRADVVAVLTGLVRNGKAIDLNGASYRAYVRAWTALYPLRRLFLRIRHRTACLLRRQTKHKA